MFLNSQEFKMGEGFSSFLGHHGVCGWLCSWTSLLEPQDQIIPGQETEDSSNSPVDSAENGQWDQAQLHSWKETPEKNQAESIRTLKCHGTCIYAALRSWASSHIKQKTSPHMESWHVLLGTWFSSLLFCFYTNRLVQKKKYEYTVVWINK